MPKAIEIAAFADNLLRTSAIPDYPNAVNGLQVDTVADVRKVAAAVDFSRRTIKGAAEAGANLLVVHHGAFWPGLVPMTGQRYEIWSGLFSAGLGIYSSHLPLDCHPTLGNNALLAKRLGLVPESSFGQFEGISIGAAGHSEQRVTDLLAITENFSGEHGGRVHATPHSAERRVGAWAICTGGGASTETIREAAERGIETMIVGEGPHWTAVHAEDHGLVLIYAGHYATETLGVQALAAAIAAEFEIDWEFISAPTGT